MYFVYILECKDTSLYTGITTNIARRFAEHKSGIASRYTRSRGANKIVYTESCTDRSSALKREAEIKHWQRAQKLILISEQSKVP